jgi:ribose-phosphate pyrophosphokinase
VLLPAIQTLGKELCIISPDAGGVERARAYAKRLDAKLAIIDKRREKANVAQIMHIIGDVEGLECVIVDDIVDTAGTLTEAARALHEAGAAGVYAAITHPVLSGPAIERIEKSALRKLVVTDTIPLHDAARACTRIQVVSIANLVGESIRRITNEESVSSLFV